MAMCGEQDNPTDCRSRKGAWIEIRQWAVRCMHEAVAPARERGLKFSGSIRHVQGVWSLPQGSVD